MLRAIQEATRMGCCKVVLETDSVVLKQAITSNDYDDSTLGALFKEMKRIIQYSFQCCKIDVCPRACNVSAHVLAAYGVSLEQASYQIWLDPLPDYVQDLVAGVSPALLN
ncbi:hypothetical protein VPH35_104926 [Triticum aestivum]